MIKSFGGSSSAESRHERKPYTFVEIPLSDVPDIVGEMWRDTAYLPRHEGADWRRAFSNAYRLTLSHTEPSETVYALINKGNPDAGEFVSFATLFGDTFINNTLIAYNTLNRPADSALPPLYKDQVVAYLTATKRGDQKKGIGKKILIAINDFSIERYGKPLHSDLERYHLTNGEGQKPGWKLWQSLERDELVEAYETPHGTRYAFKSPAGSDDAGRFTF